MGFFRFEKALMASYYTKFTLKVLIRKMMDFVLWRNLKSRHSRAYGDFSIEARAQKAHFNWENSR